MSFQRSLLAKIESIQPGPYEPRLETQPNLPFFHPQYQDTLNQGKRIVDEIIPMLSKYSKRLKIDESFEEVQSFARAIASFESPDTRTIALVGDSGVGKSSLINSLLHMQGIAKTSDLGSACTSVVTEFRYKKAGQASLIAIEAEYYSGDELVDLVTQLFCDFRNARLLLPEDRNNLDETELATLKSQSEAALSVLETAFGHKDSFSVKVMEKRSVAAFEENKAQLRSWVQELKWSVGGEGGLWQSHADDAQECHNKLEEFMGERFWPFIKVIRLYVDCLVLKNGVVLADLPGLHDTNLARVRNTQSYLLKCDFFLVCAEISRAITNASLKSILDNTILARHMARELEAKRIKNLPCAVVCTRSEDIDVHAAIQKFCGPAQPHAQFEMKRLRHEIADAVCNDDFAGQQRLKRDQRAVLMEARNRHVKQGLRVQYQKEMAGRSLEVFCVSNQWYREFSEENDHDFVEVSGIPALRKFCRSLTGRVRLEESNHFLQTELPGLLNSIEIVASSAQATKDPFQNLSFESFSNALDCFKSNVLDEVNKAFKSRQQRFVDTLTVKLKASMPDWMSAAIDKHASWSEWHVAQYKSWCIKYGDHSTAKRPQENWNADITQTMCADLDEVWCEIQTGVDKWLNDFGESLSAMSEPVKEGFEKTSIAELLNKAVDFQVDAMKYALVKMRENYERQIKQLHSYALGSTGNAYIIEKMMPAYLEASILTGKGRKSRQIKVMRERITQPNMWKEMKSQMCAEVKKLHGKARSQFKTSADRTVRNIMNDVQAAQRTALMSSAYVNAETKQLRKLFAQDVATLKHRHDCVLKVVEKCLEEAKDT